MVDDLKYSWITMVPEVVLHDHHETSAVHQRTFKLMKISVTVAPLYLEKRPNSEPPKKHRGIGNTTR